MNWVEEFMETRLMIKKIFKQKYWSYRIIKK